MIRNNNKMPGPAGCGKDGGMPADWNFVGSGEQAVISFAFPHGQPFEHRDLVDTATGKCLGSVAVDNTTHEPPANAPAWAK